MLPRSPAWRLVLLGLFTALTVAVPATAQYIYIDSNRDGLNTSADFLHSIGPTSVDIWLDTGANRDGSPGACGAAGLITYEFILRAGGGTINWGTYTAAIGGVIGTLTASSSTEHHIACFVTAEGGMPPGLYKLGTLNLEVTSGTPCLLFAASTTLAPWHSTSFGSACLGPRFDHTLRLGVDWSDSDGLTSPYIIAPSLVVFPYLAPVVVELPAPNGGACISSLTADFSLLPAGNDAVFTPAPGDLGGTLTWHPTAADLGDFTVTFTATGLDPAAETSRQTIIRLVTDPVAVDEATDAKPIFALWQNRPNPFNPTTTIVYSVPQETRVRLVVFDLSGRAVARLVDRVESMGRHEVRWSGEDDRGKPLASGVYWYRLTTDFGTETRRFVLAR